MPHTQRTVFFLRPDTIVTNFFLPHLGQVTRILPSLTLQFCDRPRIRFSICNRLEKIYFFSTYHELSFVNTRFAAIVTASFSLISTGVPLGDLRTNATELEILTLG